MMLRKLLLPLAASALLAGCVTAPYQYRGSNEGGYYYGAPSVEYRYRGGYYDGYYGGYPYYGPYRPGLSVWGSFGSPYDYGPYGYPRYGYPRYGNPYYGGHPQHRPTPRPGSNANPRPEGGPWRNIDEIARRRRAIEGGGLPPPGPPPGSSNFGGVPSAVAPPPPRPVMPRSDGGSRMGEIVRRARQSGQRED